MINDENYNYRLSLIYLGFRLLLGITLFCIGLIDRQVDLTGNYQSLEFLLSTVVYFALGFITQLFTLIKQHTPKSWTLLSAILTDVVFCLVCMHFSGGFGTGLGILLLSPVAIAGIFFYGVFAFFVAAISSLGLLLHILWSSLAFPEQAKYFVPAGLLGILFFTASFITQLIAKHIRKTELLIDEQNTITEKLELTNQLIVQNMLTGIMVIDDQNTIQTVNNSANQLLGTNYQPGNKLTGKLFIILQKWQEEPATFAQYFQEAAGLPTLKASFAPVQGDDGNIIIFLENQSQLNQQAQHLKLAALGRLSASIAHEIRNPLSTINHASQLLAESENIDGADKRLLRMIENQAARLNNIVNNVLDISRRQAANPQKVDLEQSLSRIQLQLQETRKIDIIIDFQFTPNPFIVSFDESQLHQVLYNLIDNAVIHSAKNNQQHWVGISGFMKDNRPCIHLRDKGLGIKPEDIEKVFEPFYTTNPNGSGLGLYICRELCEMNQALLDYLYDDNGEGYFQIHFAHLNRRMIKNE